MLLVQQHMAPIVPERKVVRRWLARLGAEQLDWLIQLQLADMGSKANTCRAEYFHNIRLLITQIQEENACLHLRDLAVNGHDLMALGYSGKEIGNILNGLLEAVLEEKTENERSALLRLIPSLIQKENP